MSLKKQIEEFRESFLKKGLNKDDIDIALDVFVGIASLDQALFPDKIAGIELCLVPHRSKFHAQYCHPIKGKQKECYTIFVPGLHELWKSDGKMFFLEERGKHVSIHFTDEPRKLTDKEFAAMTAAHEVRHRLQFQIGRRLKKFNAWTWKKARHPLLHKLGKFVYHFQVEERKLMYKDRLDKQFVRKRTNSDEFDSKVIEYLVLHRLSSIRNNADLLKLVKAEPRSYL